jgi:hypothetical protein
MPGPDWLITHRDQYGVQIDDFRPISPSFSIVRNDQGTITYELSLGDPFLGKDAFAPWRTTWYVYRGARLIESGIHTSRNLTEDRDTVLVSGMSWLGYLDHRIYPFTPEDYIKDNWKKWPKQWPGTRSDPPVEVRQIVEAIIEDMLDDDPDYAPPFVVANKNTGLATRYKIFPGDSTTVLSHIRTLSDQTEGFDYDILPVTLEFKMYGPPNRRDQGSPVYWFFPNKPKDGGPVTFDWTDEGPVATNTIGLGTGGPKGLKLGRSKTYQPSKEKYYRTDVVVDVGNVADIDMLWGIIDDRPDRHPQKKATLSVENPEFLLPNFYTGGRPRSLIGNRIRITRDYGYHKVDAFFLINGLNWTIDNSGNEIVDFDIEMIYDPDSV